MLEERDRHFAPALKHPRDQVGTPKVHFLSEFHRGHEGALYASKRRRHQVGMWQPHEFLFGASVSYINAEEQQDLV